MREKKLERAKLRIFKVIDRVMVCDGVHSSLEADLKSVYGV